MRSVSEPPFPPPSSPPSSEANSGANSGAAADPWLALAALEGVGSGLTAARDGIDALLRDRGLRRTTPDLTAESLLRGAHASAALAGSASSLAELREDGGDAVAQASLRISARLLGLVPTWSSAPPQAWATLHTWAATGVVDDELLGRPRDGAASARLQSLGRAVRGATSTPALLVAAVVHAELATGRLFASHDGLVARAAERLVLAARGVDVASLMVPEAGHLRLRAEYESNLRAYRDGGPAGVHAWLLYAAEAYAAGAEASPVSR